MSKESEGTKGTEKDHEMEKIQEEYTEKVKSVRYEEKSRCDRMVGDIRNEANISIQRAIGEANQKRIECEYKYGTPILQSSLESHERIHLMNSAKDRGLDQTALKVINYIPQVQTMNGTACFVEVSDGKNKFNVHISEEKKKGVR